MLTAKIQLHKNRALLGILVLWDEATGRPIFQCECLAYADRTTAAKAGNPTCDPLKLDGDTPTGTYSGFVTTYAESDTLNRVKFGPGFIALRPASGAALLAAQNG